MPRRIHVERELPAPAEAVWAAMQQPSTFLHVCHPLLAFPALTGRTAPVVEGETGTGRLLLLGVVPLHRHTIRVVRVDAAARELETEESGGALRRWHHVLRVVPAGPGTSRYSDTVDAGAGVAEPDLLAHCRPLVQVHRDCPVDLARARFEARGQDGVRP